MKIEFRDLTADEIEIRVGQAIKSDKFEGCSLLLYKNARVDMDLLDEVVGSENWQRSHTRDNANCIISIWDNEKKQWVSKEDTGTESNTEAEKGLASSSFKRAGTNWGIGRSLYSSPKIIVSCKLDNSGKRPASGIGWYVKEIGYTANHKINRLVIMETKYDKDTKVVFDWTLDKGQSNIMPQRSSKINDIDKSSNSSIEQENPVKTQSMSLKVAERVCFASGRNAKVPFVELDNSDLEWAVKKCNGKFKEAAEIVLNSRKKFLKELEDDDTPSPFD